MRLEPAQMIRGCFTPSGDKSISHRAALIAALAEGPSSLWNFSESRDCATTLNCLRQLGISIESTGNCQKVTGKGLGGFIEATGALDCGNSGSTMRMLAGLLAGQKFITLLTGDESLLTRPMRRIIEPLEMMGAKIDSHDGAPPLRITPGSPLRPLRYELPLASAQVKSSVLLAGLNVDGETCVVERQGTRDHTERMLSWFEAPIAIKDIGNNETEISVAGKRNLLSRDVQIPGDISSAAFLIGAAVVLPGSQLTVRGVGFNPTRTQFLTVLRSMGAKLSFSDLENRSNEPVGTIEIKGGMEVAANQEAKQIAGGSIAGLIDELPLLAVLGTQVSGGLAIRDASELRFKESDRISTTVENLRRMGAEVEEYPDGLRVDGPTRLQGARVDSHGDHRIAMAFSVAALFAERDSHIDGSECVDISFPGFYELLESIVVR